MVVLEKASCQLCGQFCDLPTDQDFKTFLPHQTENDGETWLQSLRVKGIETIFGFWANFQKSLAVILGFFSIRQNFAPTLTKNVCALRHVSIVKNGQVFKIILSHWSHRQWINLHQNSRSH